MIQPITTTLQDARYALRTIRKDLGFFAFAMLIIGVGIGASTAVFSVLSPLMLRPLPFQDADRLVWIANSGTGGMSAVTSRTSNVRDFRELNRSFEGLTGYFAFFGHFSYNLVGSGEPERLAGVAVADDFLDVLGVRPVIGRNFTPEEGAFGGPRAVILTHAFWTRRFAADANIVGTSINLNNEASQVIGVLPQAFDFASVFSPHSRVDFLDTLPISDETDRWGNSTSMIARLKPGATVESAQADLDLIIEGLKEADPERWGLGAKVSGLRQQIAGPFRSGLLLLAAAAAAVMLIVCVNLSNLLLAKGPKRNQEMAIRSALGASRGRLLRQLLFESLALALGGAVVGVLVATTVTRLVASSTGITIPMLRSVSVDGNALLFTLATALVAGVLVGIVPALQVSRGREATILKGGARGSSADRRSTRWLEGLVIAEVALASVLLVFGGLLLQSFRQVLDVDLGFKPAGAVAWRVSTSREFESPAEVNAFYSQLTTQVLAVPGVEAVGLTDAAPLGANRTWGLSAPGVEYVDGDRTTAFPHIVDAGYIETLHIPLLAGRHFTIHDTADNAPVAILNEAAAQAVYLGEPALGRKVTIGGEEREVVGIVAGVRHRSLEQDGGSEMYLPMMQIQAYSTLDLVVRSSLPPESLVSGVAAAIRASDPSIPTNDYESLGEVVDRAVSPRRFTLLLLSSFAATALMLAALGIYGVLSYSVSERVVEIGIRMALGESGSRVISRVVGKTLVLAGIGIALGALGAVAISRLLESQLFGVQSTDPMTFVGMSLVLFLASAVAGLIPALRASRTNPVVALQTT